MWPVAAEELCVERLVAEDESVSGLEREAEDIGLGLGETQNPNDHVLGAEQWI